MSRWDLYKMADIYESLKHVFFILFNWDIYRKISNIRRTESPNLNVSHLVLQLFLPNPMKPDVKSIIKMQLSALLQVHLSDHNFIAH